MSGIDLHKTGEDYYAEGVADERARIVALLTEARVREANGGSLPAWQRLLEFEEALSAAPPGSASPGVTP